MDELGMKGVDCNLRPEELETIKNLVQPALACLFNSAGLEYVMTLDDGKMKWTVEIRPRA